jgi:thioredoxin 1
MQRWRNKMAANNDKAVEISAREFDETINNSKPIVVIDFYAEWCMPCLMIAPILEELASKFKEIKFARVNVDENKDLSSRFNITALPTLVVFKNSEEVERITGALPEEVLEEKIGKYVK